jgi:hypothetical protein
MLFPPGVVWWGVLDGVIIPFMVYFAIRKIYKVSGMFLYSFIPFAVYVRHTKSPGQFAGVGSMVGVFFRYAIIYVRY